MIDRLRDNTLKPEFNRSLLAISSIFLASLAIASCGSSNTPKLTSDGYQKAYYGKGSETFNLGITPDSSYGSGTHKLNLYLDTSCTTSDHDSITFTVTNSEGDVGPITSKVCGQVILDSIDVPPGSQLYSANKISVSTNTTSRDIKWVVGAETSS